MSVTWAGRGLLRTHRPELEEAMRDSVKIEIQRTG